MSRVRTRGYILLYKLVQTAVQTSKHMVSDLTGGINPMIERSICGFFSYSIYLPVDLLVYLPNYLPIDLSIYRSSY